VNRTELNWLLQTIKDAETAERFVLAQYRCGRISFQMMADVVRERRCINLAANQFMTMTTCLNNEYAAELTVA
jgi:hypothetical protein